MVLNKRLSSMYLILFLLASTAVLFGQVRLPRLISDGMVLQRDTQLKIWGWAAKGEKVSVQFINSTYNTVADEKGDWSIALPKLKAGGPYEMQISASNSITIKDILIGDVWICSGQSNMGLALGWLGSVYKEEIDKSENQFIRQFVVPVGFNFKEKEIDFNKGQWLYANPKNVFNFTAVGYFFAKKIYELYKVPIGLVNASLGGSSAEAWISEEAIKSFPKYYETVQQFKNPSLIENINKKDDERYASWYKLLNENDEGYRNPNQPWSDPNLNTSSWETIQLPGYWEKSKLGSVSGVVWFRKEINIPSDMIGKSGILKLGRIIDADSVFINGKFVGATGSQYAPRSYKLPGNLLKEGKNIIAVRVINYIRHGGFVPGKQYEISVGERTIVLEGDWKYRLGTTAEPLEDRLFLGKIPAGLFNSMIAPLQNYKIKGVLWYQGESNTSRACEHYELFKSLIKDWRNNWQQGDFPFLYVQLPNFVEVNIETTKYDWAYFRESQLRALAIPNTGMAVTIDIGEYNDIHPVNKKDVGYRLALAAQKVAYGENIIYSGPIYKSMKIDGNKIILSFTNVGSGLVAKPGSELKGFEICGKNDVYFAAKAKIQNNHIVLWCNEVTSPVAARYAWANNPEGVNLYNKEGLPASPFRTNDY